MSAWRTVAVFISSTFRDMHAERDHLIRVVFPDLRERLEPHRVHLIDVDLRWGVTAAQAEDSRAVALCLEQIEACRPFFLGLLGERYGWVPDGLPEDTLAAHGWLRDHPGKSVTDWEMLLAVAGARHAFFYFRAPAVLDDIPAGLRAEFGESAPERRAELTDLKQRIRALGLPLFDGYPARWDGAAFDPMRQRCGRVAGLEDFGARVGADLWAALCADLNLPPTPAPIPGTDPLAEERDFQERFMESRLRVYVGRTEIANTLADFVDSEETAPLLLLGPSGAGKSAALAKFVADLRRRQPDTVVLPHFIGASPRSSGLRDTLRRLCLELKVHGRFAEDVPEDAAQLAATFQDFLARAPGPTRLVLVMDALNQLDGADNAQSLFWLAWQTPAHVKVVVSCLSDAPQSGPILDAFHRRPHRRARVELLQDAERRDIVRAVPSLSAKTLDDEQIGLLLDNPATRNPLFLLVALEELRGFGSFEHLNARIASLPRHGDAVTALFDQVLRRLEAEFAGDLVRALLRLLACARRGLSERELRDLTAGLAGAGELFPVLRQLRPYLLSRGGLHDFYHQNLRAAVEARYLAAPEERRATHAELAAYFRGQDDFLETLDRQRARARRLPPTPRPANARMADELPWQWARAGRPEEAGRELTRLSFLEAKVEAGMAFDLAEDFATTAAALPEGEERRRLGLLEEALRQDLYFLVRHPTALFQSLWNLCWWYDCPEAGRHYEQGDAPGHDARGEFRSLMDILGIPGDDTEEVVARQELHTLLERWRQEKEARTPGFPWLRSLRPPPHHLGTALKAVFKCPRASHIAFTRDGARVVAATDKGLRLWDLRGAELARLEGHTATVRSLAVSPSGSCLATGSEDGTVRVWDAHCGAELACLRGHTGKVHHVAFSPDGASLASGGTDGTVRLWDVVGGTERACLRGHTAAVWAVAFSPDGSIVASGSGSPVAAAPAPREVRLWDAASGRQLRCLAGATGFVHSVAFSPDGSLLLAGTSGGVSEAYSPDGEMLLSGAFGRVTLQSGPRSGEVRVWDVASGTERACLHGHTHWVTEVLFSPDGSRIVSRSWDRTVRLWDARSGSQLAHFPAGPCLFSPDGLRLITSTFPSDVFSRDEDGQIRSVDPQRGVVLDTLTVPDGAPVCMAIDPDGTTLVTGSGDGRVRLWDLTHGASLAALGGHQDGIHRCAFSPDGSRLASSSGDGTVRLWDAGSGAELFCLRGHAASVSPVAFSPDGGILASGSTDKTVRLWDAARGTALGCLEGHADAVYHITFSPDGTLLASSSHRRPVLEPEEGTVCIWDLATRARLLHIRGRMGDPGRLAFSADGTRLLAVTDEEHRTTVGTTYSVHNYQSVWIWDARSGKQLLRFGGVNEGVWGVAFSPDFQRVATGSGDGTVRLWDGTSGAELVCLQGHSGHVCPVALSPDRRRIVSYSCQDRVTRVWDVASGACLEEIAGWLEPEVLAAGGDGFFTNWTDEHSELGISSASTRRPVAWIGEWQMKDRHPNGRTWAATRGRFLTLLHLEGGARG